MRLLSVFVFSLSLCAGIAAQQPQDATNKSAPNAATARWKELGEQQAKRSGELKRGDSEGRKKMIEARKADLETFAKEFGSSPEGTKANLELAQIASMNKDQEAGKAALAALDVKHADLDTAINAAMAAKNLELADMQKSFADNALAKAKTIDERFKMVDVLKRGMKDDAAADALMKEIETSATTDEDKATVAMNKANMARRSAPRGDKAGWIEDLGQIVKLYPNTKAGKTAVSKLAAANLGPGSDPIAFTAKDMDGKDVSPADYKGKVLLIDFWATWCGPCMAELPNVKKAYAEYHDKGFEILGISLDRDTGRDTLLKTIANEQMTWRHVYDGKYWQAELAQLHDVNSIPFTILVGKDGKVIGTNFRGDKLGEAVAEALGLPAPAPSEKPAADTGDKRKK